MIHRYGFMPCSDLVDHTQVISFLRECRVDVRVDVDVTVVHVLSMHFVLIGKIWHRGEMYNVHVVVDTNDAGFLHRSHIPNFTKKKAGTSAEGSNQPTAAKPTYI